MDNEENKSPEEVEEETLLGELEKSVKTPPEETPKPKKSKRGPNVK